MSCARSSGPAPRTSPRSSRSCASGFPGLPEAPSAPPEGARFRLFEAATSLLLSATSDRPLVLVLDDLHAADEPSLLLLRFVAREIAASRVLIVCAYRDVDPGARGSAQLGAGRAR